ncbi:MAG: hypothetical protein H6729_07975 [Deltaproteobacteria bacterium]|nr:hypothetical protein [Deltaproteobacteria bacterium]
MTNLWISLCLIGGVASAVGCHAPLSNDDLLFLMLLPRDLEVEVPTTNASALSDVRASASAIATTSAASTASAQSNLSDEPRPSAKYYIDARESAERVNRDVLSPLDIIDRIAQIEPTLREEDRRTWGPIPAENGSLLLSIERVYTSTVFEGTSTSTAVAVDQFYRYSIVAAPRGVETWTAILWGVFAPVEAPDQGLGVLYVDLSAVRLVDPSSTDEGVYITAYDTRPNQRTLEVLWSRRSIADPEVAYRYHRDDLTEQGEFIFVGKDDVDQRGEDETVVTFARWLASGPGRADVVISGGDLGTYIGWARECWDDAFLRTYFESNLPNTDETLGDVSDCPSPFQSAPF